MDLSPLFQKISIVALPIILGVVFHEVAHGWVAYQFGDPTARDQGRLSLNPLVHIDLLGTIILPLLLIFSRTGMIFGYAKPVPVNFTKLRDPKKNMVWVAAAGPLTNILLAFASGIVFRLIIFTNPYYFSWSPLLFDPLLLMLRYSVRLNLILAIINLIPIPPVDGGRILVGLLPPKQALVYSQIEPFGLLILIILIFFDPLRIFTSFIWPIIRVLDALFLGYSFSA
jgi:Zn-dependent protease